MRTFSIKLTSTRFGYSEGDLTIVTDYCGDRIDVKTRTRELVGLELRSYYFRVKVVTLIYLAVILLRGEAA